MDPVLVDSPALPLLRELVTSGFLLRLTADDRVQVEPGSRLTPEQRRLLVEHKADLVALLRRSHVDIAVRVEAFRRQLEATPAPAVPAFLFRPDIPYVPGLCFSCGDSSGRQAFGRCWQCSLAWRLACRLPIPAALATALDSVRVIG